MFFLNWNNILSNMMKVYASVSGTQVYHMYVYSVRILVPNRSYKSAFRERCISFYSFSSVILRVRNELKVSLNVTGRSPSIIM